MCWRCDDPEQTIDDDLDRLRQKILRHGWAVQCVEGRRPRAYTIGLHDHGLPELLVTGLPPKSAVWLFENFRKRVSSDRRPAPGDQVALPAGTRLELVGVEHPEAHMEMAVAIEGPDLEAVQLVWADSRGRWPWAPMFDDGQRCQPVLGSRVQHA